MLAKEQGKNRDSIENNLKAPKDAIERWRRESFHIIHSAGALKVLLFNIGNPELSSGAASLPPLDANAAMRLYKCNKMNIAVFGIHLYKYNTNEYSIRRHSFV